MTVFAEQFCSPPVFNGDHYLYYTCGKSGYQYGSECTLDCKGSYPLVGNNKMVCDRNATSDELYWDWGSQGKPYCKRKFRFLLLCYHSYIQSNTLFN